MEASHHRNFVYEFKFIIVVDCMTIAVYLHTYYTLTFSCYLSALHNLRNHCNHN